MRAIIPAVVLLFIGLVAALPFRRPPTSLEEPVVSANHPAPERWDTPTILPPEGDEADNQNSAPVVSSSPYFAQQQTVPQALPRFPVPASYGEVVIPLTEAQRSQSAPLASAPVDHQSGRGDTQPGRSDSQSGRWRQGLGFAEVPTRRESVPEQTAALPESKPSVAVLVPVDQSLLEPPSMREVNRPTTPVAVASAMQRNADLGNANSSSAPAALLPRPVEPQATMGAPSSEVNRVRHFIREPDSRR